MKVRICPKCGKHNSADAWYCADKSCGEILSVNAFTDIPEPLPLDVDKLLQDDSVVGEPSTEHTSSTTQPTTPKTAIVKTKKCPYCAEVIKQEAIVCRFCGRNLVGEDSPTMESDDEAEAITSPFIPKIPLAAAAALVAIGGLSPWARADWFISSGPYIVGGPDIIYGQIAIVLGAIALLIALTARGKLLYAVHVCLTLASIAALNVIIDPSSFLPRSTWQKIQIGPILVVGGTILAYVILALRRKD